MVYNCTTEVLQIYITYVSYLYQNFLMSEIWFPDWTAAMSVPLLRFQRHLIILDILYTICLKNALVKITKIKDLA